MKKLLILCLLLCGCVCVFAELQMWVDDINMSNGHVTFSDHLVLPTDKGVILLKSRKDYICSQNKYAVLWLEGYNNEDLSKPIDISFMVDKNYLRKYVPADPGDYAVNIIKEYCEHQ